MVLKKFPKLFYLIKKIYHLIFKKRIVTYWINKILGENDNFIMQIGSNDGKTGDPLFTLIKKNKNWTALFVEPVPFLFERLRQNYGIDNRFFFENVAINNGNKQKFYWVDSSANVDIENLPIWYDQLNSFNRDHIIRHLGDKIIPFIKSIEIEGFSLPQLIKKYSQFKLDMLHIDTEGYDWEILSQLSLNDNIPSIILYEHSHLNSQDKNLSKKYLSEHYYIFPFKGDYFCVMKKHNFFQSKIPKFLEKIKIN